MTIGSRLHYALLDHGQNLTVVNEDGVQLLNIPGAFRNTLSESSIGCFSIRTNAFFSNGRLYLISTSHQLVRYDMRDLAALKNSPPQCLTVLFEKVATFTMNEDEFYLVNFDGECVKKPIRRMKGSLSNLL